MCPVPLFRKKLCNLYRKAAGTMLLGLCLICLQVSYADTEIVGDVRVQTLASTLIRLEVQGPNGFEDRPTFHVVERSWTGVPITRSSSNSIVSLTTSDYIVKVPDNAASLNDVVVVTPAGDTLWTGSGNVATAKIKCRWIDQGDMYLGDDDTKVIYTANANDASFEWIISVNNNICSIRNKETGHYMHIENGLAYIECSDVPASAPSRNWVLRENDGYYRIRNASTTDRYIHTENRQGYPECGMILDTWHSAQWSFLTFGGPVDLYTSNRVILPHPASNPSVFAFADVPRVVPPEWGYNVAPSGVPFSDVNGWDFTNNATDVYVFIPGNDGRQLRKDFITLTGRTELIPLYALGGWDSRYYAYTQAEALAKIDRFRSSNIPLDIFVVDTDWRIGASQGYDINTDLFPNMEEFLHDAHNKNLRIVFNDHPEPQAAMCLNPTEVSYRNEKLRSLFDIGLDFWWFDRNWSTCIVPPDGINKEIFGMYIYQWVVKDYYPDRRPLIMANFDGINNGAIASYPPNIAAHRYTMQWTGDSRSGMSDLAQEIRDALYAGIHAPFPYLSSDIGGHQGDPTAAEYCRWLEYSAFSPIHRPHCTRGQTRDAWDYAAPVEDVMRNFVQMRMRLLPHMYIAARNNYDTGEPILRRCDLEFPEYTEAAADNQYFFGRDILVAPMTTTGTSRRMWFPPGTWVDCWIGNLITGPQSRDVTADIQQIPLYVREGSIVVLAPDMEYTDEKPWSPITLDIYPSADQEAQATLYEDDRVSNDYRDGDYRFTQFTAVPDDATKTIIVRINAAQGTYTGALNERAWIVRMRIPEGWGDTLHAVTVDGQETDWTTYDPNRSAMPFKSTGSVRDNMVLQVAVTSGAVTSQRTIVFFFDQITQIQSPLTCLSSVTVNPHAEKNIIVSMLGRPVGTCTISLTLLSLKGQQVLHTTRTTDNNSVAFDVTGSTGRPIARGTYLYSIQIEQKGMHLFHTRGKAIVVH